MRGRLTPRIVLASGLLAIVVGAAFAVLLSAVSGLRDSGQVAERSFDDLARTSRLEQHVIDMETGLRGYVLTRRERFLAPFDGARAAFPADARALVEFASSRRQRRLAREIAAAGNAYIADYALGLVKATRRGDPAARSVEVTADGKRRIDALRALFRRYERTQSGLARTSQARSDRVARRALAAATAGLIGSVLVILLVAGSFLRAVVVPVRRAAAMAGRLAGGDLSVRMPETGPGEIGDLERAFNTMGHSLELNRDALQLVADEQAALRRVATLVAEGVSPDALFSAVAGEVRLLLDADAARLYRYEGDGTAALVAETSEPEVSLTPGYRVLPNGAVPTVERPLVRVDDVRDVPGEDGQVLRDSGLRSGAGRLIVVDGRPWGLLSVAWRRPGVAAGVEARLADFGDLVATAIANAQSRAELAASRARVVAAGDETRRRIERDLHDGAQQRLVSLALALRAIEAKVPDDLPGFRTQVDEVATGVAAVTDELREMSRGLHPAILSRGGLGAALRALARRSAVPIDLDVSVDRPLPEAVEVAAYYVASEALTNAAKHARASAVSLVVGAEGGSVRLVVRDDGIGGADPSGSGLLGLKDRVEALGGTLEVSSPGQVGTTLCAVIPIPVGAARDGSSGP